jgi:hypothetical protein
MSSKFLVLMWVALVFIFWFHKFGFRWPNTKFIMNLFDRFINYLLAIRN